MGGGGQGWVGLGSMAGRLLCRSSGRIEERTATTPSANAHGRRQCGWGWGCGGEGEGGSTRRQRPRRRVTTSCTVVPTCYMRLCVLRPTGQPRSMSRSRLHSHADCEHQARAYHRISPARAPSPWLSLLSGVASGVAAGPGCGGQASTSKRAMAWHGVEVVVFDSAMAVLGLHPPPRSRPLARRGAGRLDTHVRFRPGARIALPGPFGGLGGRACKQASPFDASRSGGIPGLDDGCIVDGCCRRGRGP